MDSNEEAWNKLFKELNAYDISSDLINEADPIQLKELFLDYFDDYCKVSYLEDIKENDLYLINKWKFIFFHNVELDDFFFYLDCQKKLQRPSSLSPKKIQKKEEKKSKSLNMENNNHKNKRQNLSFSSLKPLKNIISFNLNNTESGSSLNESFEILDESNSNIKDENDEKYEKETLEKNLNEFRLTEAKKSLQIFDNETIGGKEYELNCKRVLNLMLLFIQRDNYILSNPNKIPIQNIIKFLKIKELEDEELTNSDAFEIDIVINDLKVKDLNKLIKNYSSHFFFTENLQLKIEEEKVNFIGEISRNFLFQISNQFKQIKTYYAVFKIFESLNMSNSKITDEEKKYILSYFNLQNNNNKNIFVIITDGSYFILRFTVSTILAIKQKLKENKLKSGNIQSFINDQINKNEKLLKYLTSYKFRNLNKLIYQTFEALKFLDEKNIHYCLFFIGNKENNKIENFFKETKNEKGKEIKYETIFKFQIKSLINKLIESKEKITYKITQYGKSIQKKIQEKKILKQINRKFSVVNLSEYFKISITFYLTDINIKIKSNNNFNVNISYLPENQFDNKYKKLFKEQNIESISIFVDDKHLLANNSNNNKKNILIIKENQLPTIYEVIMGIIKKNSAIFETILKKKIMDKSNQLKESKKEYSSKYILNREKLIDKLKEDKDLCIQIENIVEFLFINCVDKIDNEAYIKELIEYKKSFETLLGKVYVNKFEEIIANNFILLEENIKASIIYDYISKDLITELISDAWNDIYIF